MEILIIMILLQMSLKLEFPIIIGEAESNKVSNMIYTKKPKPKKYFLMTVTAYSNHPNCITDKWRDGKTATNTPIREGVAAINVDYINGGWKVKSPLSLGDKVYIEGIGEYNIEDTGYFTEENYKQDFWNVDIYIEDYNEAVKFGRKLKKVYVINI